MAREFAEWQPCLRTLLFQLLGISPGKTMLFKHTFIYLFQPCYMCIIQTTRLCLSCRTIDRSVFKPIVQIAVIDRSESSDCQLMAVTHAGKLYWWIFVVSNTDSLCASFVTVVVVCTAQVYVCISAPLRLLHLTPSRAFPEPAFWLWFTFGYLQDSPPPLPCKNPPKYTRLFTTKVNHETCSL